MAKSFIRNVDGIGIWVRETTYDKANLVNIIVFALAVFCSFLCECLWVNGKSIWGIAMSASCCAWISLTFDLITYLPAYEVYPGSDVGTTIIKTTPEADQLAICKAAKEIEAQCHDIAAKRRELDRIAGNCK
ncbi:MAG: hypothetical protein WCX79_00885 [Candidatus Paceibacterota bacterium]|jgi:hypothetical protein